MAYTTYITEALVCGNYDRNTSDRVFLLFTREAGMVWAHARSVRKEASKQRYALQEFSHIRASLVSGKGGWRVAGVESLGNLYFSAHDRATRGLVRNIVRLLRRTIQGEGAHHELFDDVVHTLSHASEAQADELELILSLRILYALGYISRSGTYDALIDAATGLDSLQHLRKEQLAPCRRAVEEALVSSQL